MTNAMVLRPQTFDQLVTFAELAARSSMVPKDYIGKPENIMLAIQMGSELGLAPMQSLQNIAVINGRPSIWGDAMLGLCRSFPLCQSVVETLTGEGDAMEATCVAKRTGNPDVVSTFSVDDAKKAGLWSKPGPWQQYPKRMLQMRARGFALRDAFPDVLRGLIGAEEARDMVSDAFTGTTIAHVQEPLPTAPPTDRRSEINADVPMKKRTWADVVADINAAAMACTTQDEALALGDHELVKKVYEHAGDATKEEVHRILGEAYQRCVEAGMAAEPAPETVP